MSTTTAQARVDRWPAVVAHFGFVMGGATLVGGEEAAAVASVLNQRAAALPITWGPDLALLQRGPAPDLHASSPAATGLDSGTVDLVVLRHAWHDQASLAGALAEAHRVLKPGGGLVVADLAVEELLGSTPQRYPYLLLTLLVPGLARTLRADHVDLNRMTLEVVRSGLKAVRSYLLEDEHGAFETRDAYVAFGRDGGWRGWEGLSPEDRERVLARLPDLLERVVPLGGVRAVEPWIVAGGIKPKRS